MGKSSRQRWGGTQDRKEPIAKAPGMATCVALRPFKARAIGTEEEESREHDFVSGTPR